MKFFGGSDEKAPSREENYATVRKLVAQLDGYPNAQCFHDELTRPSQFGTTVPDQAFRELAEKAATAAPEKLQEVLDTWLIEQEDLVPMIAGVRLKHGLFENEEGVMSYPTSPDHPEFDQGDEEATSDLAKEDYVRRMLGARQVLGDDFQKAKLDNLYCDTGGGPAFEEKTGELEAALGEAAPEDRPPIVEKFLAGLR